MSRSSIRNAISALVISLGLATVPQVASAIPFLEISSRTLNGATGVRVGGTLYDVQFRDGACASVFGLPCQTSSFQFRFDPAAAAAAASRALLDEVFSPLPWEISAPILSSRRVVVFLMFAQFLRP
jgi:hypothetical protein